MNKKKLALMASLWMSLICSGSGDVISQLLENEGLVERPLPEGDAWEGANESAHTFFVELVDDQVLVRKASEADGRDEISLKVGGGEYVGVDRGEFVGGLYFVDSNSRRHQIVKGNIKSLIRRGNEIIVIEGLEHKGVGRESVSIIRDADSQTNPVRITLLPSAPEVAIIEENGASSDDFVISIVGNNSFMQISGTSELSILMWETFWRGLYPTSVVRYEESYLIGMRSGVAIVQVDPLGDHRVRYFAEREKF